MNAENPASPLRQHQSLPPLPPLTISPGSPLVRLRFAIQGRAQGVGFRPFIYRLASDLHLTGFVGNDSQGVFLEIQGTPNSIQNFYSSLQSQLPPLARITQIQSQQLLVIKEDIFFICPSKTGSDQRAHIAPDIAICPDCLRELLTPADRRYRYPFINCTNCGPRYSILRSVPYDRENTTMKSFTMCAQCLAEYEDPNNRRFHAQPNACPVCGPHVWLTDSKGITIPGDPIIVCSDLLREGKIIAIKGLGGFHLACRADTDSAVLRLRNRKLREAKPLALMVGSLEQTGQIVDFDESSLRIFVSLERPIVLVPKKPGAPISPHIAPGTDHLGVMLAYTPLHILLFENNLPPLVMTSGNPASEPLCIDNHEALSRLSDIADFFLLHNRNIERGVDDSVVLANSAVTSKNQPSPIILPIRRARGYAPAPIQLSQVYTDKAVLALGGEMKSVICLLNGRDAILSEHLGELDNPPAYRNFLSAIDRFQTLLRVEPNLIAYDLHPDYAATRYAKTLSLPSVGVQHHHAHIVSVMAEQGLTGQVVGIAADGTGYGSDGQIWGGEILVCNENTFSRAGQIQYYPLPGGDAAARETWRPAAGWLRQVFGEDWIKWGQEYFTNVDPAAMHVVDKQLRSNTKQIQTSSLGRLFDAAAFLLGICSFNRFEAEAAMALEAAARMGRQSPHDNIATDGYEIRLEKNVHQIDPGPLLRRWIQRGLRNRDAYEQAWEFHETVSAALAECASQVAKQHHLHRIVLSGGCFINRILLERVSSKLAAMGFDIYVHEQVPTGDGGIALGQAVIAAATCS